MIMLGKKYHAKVQKSKIHGSKVNFIDKIRCDQNAKIGAGDDDKLSLSHLLV